MLACIKLALNYILPKQALTELAGWCAAKRFGWLTKAVIDLFIWYYKVDMQEFQKTDTAMYNTFNDFFVRRLRDNLYQIKSDSNVLVCPANGVISQIGLIQGDQILQAKEHSYSLLSLLAGSYAMTKLFQDGVFVTIYLSPKDYHRVHMPCNGVLREMIYVPGDLYALNLFMRQRIPNLFARNERLICRFDTPFGPVVQVLVGATIVGSIETIWSGTVTPPRQGIIKCWNWPLTHIDNDVITLRKGDEMGRFKLGSTVITLLSSGKITLDSSLCAGSQVRLGMPLAIRSENRKSTGD
ncbi:Phosphatidylserine decarboxylase proenzyme [Candidatus Erwinia haradaeae]|uniref:Phosphatidylserine decarboxylase proenzyme n=1 Tax=Candidatus Erwinia haradaeae TaxID=1922217 RepID=A0A451DD30_9GAMM|nr:archaetidylserine decarboxylase [Candidatus Erwinia haradaeae]VFP84364.1 Phosphatidylserine decarboxylase proenzyme [Candidatus Erwinia haradaeae]